MRGERCAQSVRSSGHRPQDERSSSRRPGAEAQQGEAQQGEGQPHEGHEGVRDEVQQDGGEQLHNAR